jgi:3',5'-cyclic AMP phosphodiesterase CpdA
MSPSTADGGALYAVSDLHVSYPENLALVNDVLRPVTDRDWLIVAGDVGEIFADVERTLAVLAERFERVVWVPGNHELWTHPEDPCRLQGKARYERYVGLARNLGVLTPEDPYALWEGPGGPLVVAPLFVLYDYTFRAPGTRTKDESLAFAYRTGIVCGDESFLSPAPLTGIDTWCAERVTLTERRLSECPRDVPLLLVNHFPLVRQPTEVLRYPEFAQWCGTTRTADWHRRFAVHAVVYGHLHIPRTTWYDGVRFEEVSIGYPRERAAAPIEWPIMRRILPPSDS